MKQILEVIEPIYNNLELRSTVVPLFISNPGIGKSQSIREFAARKGVKLVTIIASQKMPHEISGLAMPLTKEKKMTYFDYDLFIDLKDGDIIFFDELLNANPMILNACLTILEDRVLISGKKLPKVMIVAAANHQGAAILTPQIVERFVWYTLSFNKTEWVEYMQKYLIPEYIIKDLCDLIINEKFVQGERNFITPRSVEKNLNLLIKDVPTPYSNKLRPILNKLVTNDTENDIIIGDYTFQPNESIEWLKLKKIISKNEIITK